MSLLKDAKIKKLQKENRQLRALVLQSTGMTLEQWVKMKRECGNLTIEQEQEKKYQAYLAAPEPSDRPDDSDCA